MRGGRELRQAAGGGALDRAAGDASHLRDLGFAEVFVVPQNDHLSFTSGQSAQGPQNAVPVGLLALAARCAVTRIGHFGIVERYLAPASATPAVACSIDQRPSYVGMGVIDAHPLPAQVGLGQGALQ